MLPKKAVNQKSSVLRDLAVVYREPRSLVPYDKNSRTHSKEQIKQLRASIREFGFTNPVLLRDDERSIGAGHARVQAAIAEGLDRVPTIVLPGLTDDQWRAYIIADNKLALNAGWDEAMLLVEFGALTAVGFDIALTGFNLAEISALSAVKEDGERELTAEEKEIERAAWRLLLADWDKIIATTLSRDYVSTNITKGGLAADFVGCLLNGREIRRTLATAYCPHRLFVAGDAKPVSDLCRAGLAANNVLDSIIWQNQGKQSFDKFLFGTVAIHGHRAPADFPATLARDLIDEFCKKGGAVLDPCHGWGGRLLGFLLSRKANRYQGFDVDPRTSAGVSAIFDDLRGFAMMEKQATFVCLPYEDADLAANAFDFALTSPPYYDVEKYDGDLSSWRRYTTFEDWVAGFYAPLIRKTAKALKRRAVFALQVGNQSYPLESTAKRIAEDCGLSYVETRATSMQNNQAQTSEEDGEVILILRRK